MVQSLWKTIWQSVINIHLPHDSVIPLLGIHSNAMKAYVDKDICIKFFSSFIHNSPKVERTQCPHTSEWINKLQYNHTTEHYAAIKRNKPSTH